MNPLIQLKSATILPVLIALTLCCFGLLPQARAVCQQGCLTNSNTVLGDDALVNNTTGTANTATGVAALHFNTTGDNNTATGNDALQSNTIGADNTATGSFALHDNTRGVSNTAVGSTALFGNTTGSNNTANGSGALFGNTIGVNNTASGGGALAGNSRGNDNTAIGFQALGFNITGNNNAGNGFQALLSNTTGSSNTATGGSALYNNTTGRNNVALGANAGFDLTTGNNNIDIGNVGVPGESAKIRIGTQGTQNGTFIAGIYNVNEGGTIKPVYINSTGRLGTQPPASSRRFKTNIKPMDKSSEALLALKPVTFHYKNDEVSTAQFGLIAEEVAKVSPELVVRDDDGEIYTVRYEAVNAMLLNEFLKERRKNGEQEKTIAALKSGMTALAATVKEQASQIQKVSAQLEASKPAPQVVVNTP